MMFVSFNVNSIRTRLHQLEAVIDALAPDFIGLQETKVQDDDFPVEAIRELGYHVHFHGQKTHYGVALLSKAEPDEIVKGYPWDGEDSQRRLITGQFTVNGEKLTVINGYFPQGESRDHPVKFPAKEKFYADLMRYLDELKQAGGHVVVMGDMNISPTDKDIGIGADNAKRWLRPANVPSCPRSGNGWARLSRAATPMYSATCTRTRRTHSAGSITAARDLNGIPSAVSGLI